jgi:hypothetical protein
VPDEDEVPDEEEVLLDGEDAGVAVEGAVADVPASFFEPDPESVLSPDGGFILLE